MAHRPRAPHWLASAVLAATVLAPVTACAVAPGAAGRIAPAPVPPFGAAAFAPVPGAGAPDDGGPVGDVPRGAYEELAGSVAGAGRERPGWPVAEPANPETVLASRPLRLRPRQEPAEPPPLPPTAPSRPSAQPARPARPLVPSPSPEPSLPAFAQGTEPNGRAADLAAHILPLGTGLALMGLGLGFMGMRLRRGP
ncbi:hypothetical protein [Streptomyces sp. MJM1172]|uniref:hypothetical protein n=1 Tax=Streptomyces sp. MJM1172 TaxID=1703926 RepID=UPI000939B773|nr:hypothetical protein [Streptomyces sp. MJM1172]OKI65650.1 hypothetical protein AMK15_09600 [Streptomyces sp. MJM1172]